MSLLRRDEYDIWQYGELRVDLKKSQTGLRRGESVIDKLDSVEDSKSGSGERGCLMVTNLRLLWVSHAKPWRNVSIGWECMAPGKAGVAVKNAQSRLRGNLQALVINATFASSKFDFIFTSLVKASPRLFTTAISVFRAFETSRAYRNLRLRGAIIRPEDRSVVLLPRERVFSIEDGVWNLANDAGNLGAATVTSHRFVWRATLTENFNVSIPYGIMSKVVIVDHSKFGPTLVISVTPRAGGQLFGFRMEPTDKLDKLLKEVVVLRETYFTSPDFGVVYEQEEEEEGEEEGGGGGKAATLGAGAEDVEVAESIKGGGGSGGDAYAAYLAEGAKERDRPVLFSYDLGLAVETPPAGMSVSELWQTL